MQNLNDKLTHNEFTAELVEDHSGQSIALTQVDFKYGEPSTVMLHPWQLRAVCENFGLVASDPAAQKTIATLTRRLQLLNDRIVHLADWLVSQSDHQHADLGYEMNYSRATADISTEFCAELMDDTKEATPAPASNASAKATPTQASTF